MKKPHLYVLFLLLLLKLQCIAQNNNSWYYEYLNFGINGYVVIETKGDTIIQGKSCHVLTKTRIIYNEIYSVFDTTFVGNEYIYHTDDTTFRFKFSDFYPLYIFNGNPGDTYLTAGNNEILGCDSLLVVDIDSVGTTVINNDTLRWVSVSTNDTSSFDLSGKIIEKIGPVDFYMFPEYTWICAVDANEGGNFRCFYKDDILYHSISPQNECDYIWTIINEYNKQDNISIFPNPTSNLIYIDIEEEINEKDINIKILNILGKEIKYKQEHIILPNKLRLKIYLNNLDKGVYNICIYKKMLFMRNSLIIKG